MKKKNITNESETDWARVKNMRDEDIDLSDLPEVTPEMFANAIVRKGLKPIPPKRLLTLRLDEEVVEFFKGQGSGYQTRINSLLKAYVDAHKAA